MNWKKLLAGLFTLQGLALATTFFISFLIFSIFVMPNDITIENIQIAPSTSFYLCSNSSIQTSYCPAFSINASTSSNNATLNVTWFAGNGTVCIVKLVDTSLAELSDFSSNKTYTLPSTYPAGATFGLKITRVVAKTGSCDFDIVPVVE